MPTIKGKVAKRFYKNINNGEISEKQKNFLEECKKLEKSMWLNLNKSHKKRGMIMQKQKEYPKELIHQKETYKIEYIQEPRHGDRGELTVAHIIYNGSPLIAVSERSPVESWSANQGRLVAGGRLIKKLKKRDKNIDSRKDVKPK